MVYIPRCDPWEGVSETTKDARAYFMCAFFEQNADLTVEDPKLLMFFKVQLDGKPVNGDSY